jgi:Sec-independent protein secretion pathway component TatC
MIKRPIRIILAIILIIFLYGIYITLGNILFGWKHGGGAIPMMLFFGLGVFLWKKITKKEPEKNGKDVIETEKQAEEPKE